MKESADGLPALGPSPRLLGVRPGNAPKPDVPAVLPQDVFGPGQGGLSVAPGDPMGLLPHRRPASLGGSGRDPVWVLDTADLGPDLQFCAETPAHGLVEPRRPMTLQVYEQALASLRPRWRLYCR
jgi:hypothetical protein